MHIIAFYAQLVHKHAYFGGFMKVVLAFSGGLDTCATIPWLKNKPEVDEVIAVLVDVGQEEDFKEIEKKALILGADKVEIYNQVHKMADQGLKALVLSQAVYDNTYLLGTAIARPFIADALIDCVEKYDAQAICHGATGKGNDYLRLEQRILAKLPQIKIISPWREWECTGRQDLIEMLKEKGLHFPDETPPYSMDANLWHISYEGGSLEDLNTLPAFFNKMMQLKGSTEITLDFVAGVPKVLNGQPMPLAKLISTLNTLLYPTSYGWKDIIETRTNGLKSRGIYHTPAGSLLYFAQEKLSQCYFPQPVLQQIKQWSDQLGTMIYHGIWDHPLQQAIVGALEQLYKPTTGSISITISGASAIINERQASPNLFDPEWGGFDSMDSWNSEWSNALIVFQNFKYTGLPMAALS